MRRFLTVSAAILSFALLPTAAHGALGDRLDQFVPSPSGNGRGIELAGASTTAYYSSVSSEDKIYLVDLKTHASAGTLDTNLEFVQVGVTFGALAWDPIRGVLWGSEFGDLEGWIDQINPGTGAVTRVFNARITLEGGAGPTNIDGLAVDTDGTLWLSQDGLGIATTNVYHVNADTGASIGAQPTFTAPYNSGIAVDGDNLWLADNNEQLIYQYTKTGTQVASFSSNNVSEVEDITIDTCSFQGKKVLWANTAAFSGAPMAAWEIGTSDNAGCPAAAPGPPQGPDTITIGDGTNKPIYAGQPIWLDATSPWDPTGTIFIYIWLFSDYSYNLNKPKVTPTLNDTVQDKGKVQHTFECAGFYAPKVTVIDSNGARKEVSKDLTVRFSKKATKKHGGLKVTPNLVASETRAKINLKVKKLKKKKKRRTKIKSILYKLDGKKLGKRKKPKKAVIAKIKRAGPHTLEIDVKFKGPRGKKRIKECFQLS